MQCMALAGAKVLNADAVEFARRAGITILAQKEGDPSGNQTKVHGGAPVISGPISVVAHKSVTRLVGPASAWPQIAQRIAQVGGRTMAVMTSQGLHALVDRTGIPNQDPGPLSKKVKELGVDAQTVGTVTLVGGGLLQRISVLEEAEQEFRVAEIHFWARFVRISQFHGWCFQNKQNAELSNCIRDFLNAQLVDRLSVDRCAGIRFSESGFCNVLLCIAKSSSGMIVFSGFYTLTRRIIMGVSSPSMWEEQCERVEFASSP